jgi:hypothetical protein
MKKQTFEEFLQEVFNRFNPGVLDDELQDSFDAWLSNMDIERLLTWGETYGNEQYLAGKEEILT